MRDDTTLGDNDIAEKLVQPKSNECELDTQIIHGIMHALLIVADGELKVTRNDTLLLVVTRSITRKLENLGGKILKDSSQVDYAKQGLRPLSATWRDYTYIR